VLQRSRVRYEGLGPRRASPRSESPPPGKSGARPRSRALVAPLVNGELVAQGEHLELEGGP